MTDDRMPSSAPESLLPLGSFTPLSHRQRVFEQFSCEFKAREGVQARAARRDGGAGTPETEANYALRASRVKTYVRWFLWPQDTAPLSGEGVEVCFAIRSVSAKLNGVQVGPAQFSQTSGWLWCQHKPRTVELTSTWSNLTVTLGGPTARGGEAVMIHVRGDCDLELGSPQFLPRAPTREPMLLVAADAWREGGLLRVTASLVSPIGLNLEGGGVDLLAGDLVIHRGLLKECPTGEFLLSVAATCSSRTADRPLSLRAVSTGQRWPLHRQTNPRTPEVHSTKRPPGVVDVASRVEGEFAGLLRTPSGALVASGWARDPLCPGQGVTLDLRVDGQALGTGYATATRQEVVEEHGGSAVCGYGVEIPHNFSPGKSLQLEVAVRQGSDSEPRQRVQCRMPPFGYRLPGARAALTLPVHRADNSQRKSCAAIVLTQDGAEVLCGLLASIVVFEPETFRQIVVVDHESVDNTEDVLERFARRLPLKVLRRPRAASFSESNNVAAALCTEDVLVFVNNDLEFVESVVARMVKMAVSGAGVVGLKLLDPAIPGTSGYRRAPQHVGIHLTPHGVDGQLRPFESRMLTEAPEANHQSVVVPCVTAALAAVEREFFEQMGGFDERYFYGWEDSDLCLRAMQRGRPNVSINAAACVHVRGYSRRTMSRAGLVRRGGNAPYFRSVWDYSLLRSLRCDLTERTHFWTGRRLHIGFVVSEVGDNATAGDCMSASELGRALVEEYACEVFFYAKNELVDALEIDVLVVMTDDFDVRVVENLGAAALVVAWARNWFHRWAVRPWRERFDVWLSSSKVGAEYLTEELGRTVDVLRLGTNAQRFHSEVCANELLRSQVAFTGNCWGPQRDIAHCVEQLRCDLRVFGGGWESEPSMQRFCCEPVPYEKMPQVYRSTQLVLDDSNYATESWASLNSRVYDALACGTLVVTNNARGSQEVFDGLLPTYHDAESLQRVVQTYLGDPQARQQRAAKLQQMVMNGETYQHRAVELFGVLKRRANSGLRIAIKLSVPAAERADSWGDWHFGMSLRRELEALGHCVRLDCLEDWKHSSAAVRDDACIVLRGLERYEPRPNQLNLLWVISHPHKVSLEEANAYDEVFVASEVFAEHLRQGCDVPVHVLPQCTDERYFYPPDSSESRNGVVFVANSRLVRRPVIEAALETNTPVSIYGTRWEGLVPDEMVVAQTVSNPQVGEIYRKAAVVLNDHWADMQRCGFVSNRLFDAVACGAMVVSDEVQGLEALVPGSVQTFSSRSEFAEIVRTMLDAPTDAETRRQAAQWVRTHHTFASRAKVLDECLGQLDRRRNRLSAQAAKPLSPVDEPTSQNAPSAFVRASGVHGTYAPRSA